MLNTKSLSVLVILIIIFSAVAASFGIFTHDGDGNYTYKTIRGKMITIYGSGIYKQMSNDVAIQGIAQDYITLFAGIPLLIIGLIGTLKGSLKWRLVLSGTLAYFFVTYLFYLVMAMYNYLFLLYAALLALSFFGLATIMLSFDIKQLKASYLSENPIRFSAKFLIFNVIMIALLWLSVIVPPMLDGTLYPDELNHYTTLIVQGMDLGLLLPIALVSAILLLKKKEIGYLLVPVYTVFLSILMTALTAKLIAMGLQGQSILPAIVIIPVFALTAMVSSILTLKQIDPVRN
jgi:hypothetical protein